jgi:hypothetical protein
MGLAAGLHSPNSLSRRLTEELSMTAADHALVSTRFTGSPARGNSRTGGRDEVLQPLGLIFAGLLLGSVAGRAEQQRPKAGTVLLSGPRITQG